MPLPLLYYLILVGITNMYLEVSLVTSTIFWCCVACLHKAARLLPKAMVQTSAGYAFASTDDLAERMYADYQEIRSRNAAYYANLQRQSDHRQNTRSGPPPYWCVVLDVKHDATLAEIQAAFRTKAHLYHPDKPANNSENVAKFCQLKKAYDAAREHRKGH